jgi:hypothetical protein
MIKGLQMKHVNNTRRRKNLIVGWIIGVLAIVLYVSAIYFGAGS